MKLSLRLAKDWPNLVLGHPRCRPRPPMILHCPVDGGAAELPCHPLTPPPLPATALGILLNPEDIGVQTRILVSILLPPVPSIPWHRQRQRGYSPTHLLTRVRALLVDVDTRASNKDLVMCVVPAVYGHLDRLVVCCLCCLSWEKDSICIKPLPHSYNGNVFLNGKRSLHGRPSFNI